jgi:hypothetical protein
MSDQNRCAACGERSECADRTSIPARTEAAAEVVRTIRPAIFEGRVSIKEAAAMQDHLVDLILRGAGIINYASNLDATTYIAKLDLAPYLQTEIAAIRSAFYGSQALAPGVHERAQPLRHPGDMGATFAPPDAAAAKHIPSGFDDP